MSYLFLFIVFIATLLLLIPIIFKLVFKKILGFSHAHIKLKHPFKLLGTFLQLKHPIWAIELFTIYIPQIHFEADLKKAKIRLVIDCPKIILSRSAKQLLPIHMLDGKQEHKLLYNLVTILNNSKAGKKKSSHQKQSSGPQFQNRFVLVFKAGVQFLLLIIIQFFEIKINKAEISIVSSIQEDHLNFDTLDGLRKSLMMMECLSEYNVFVPDLSLSARIRDSHVEEVMIECPEIKALTARHLENSLIDVTNLNARIYIPFTFSFEESFNRLGINVEVNNLVFATTPIDFEDFSLLMHQLLFEPDKITSLTQEASKKSSSRSSSSAGGKVEISVTHANLKLTEISQPEHDTVQASKYLSNIAEVNLQFDNVGFSSEQGLNISQSGLSLKKYNESKYDLNKSNSMNLEQKLIENNIFKIINLKISQLKQAGKGGRSSTKISHDPVKVACQKQQLALLAKLFRIVNERVICDEYDEQIYQMYASMGYSYIKGKLSFEEIISGIIEKKVVRALGEQNIESQRSSRTSRKSSSSQSLMTESLQTSGPSEIHYSPSHIELQLQLAKLTHKINLTSASYKQSRSHCSQISHQLLFSRIHIEYMGIKQFHVNSLTLFYKQSEQVNSLSIFTKDIQMVQNDETLRDYLIGFTIFKQLLGFIEDSDDLGSKDRDNSKGGGSIEESRETQGQKKGKINKKSIDLQKITLCYFNENVVLKKLMVDKQALPNGKLKKLVFTLDRCEFNIEKLTNSNPLFRNPINSKHSLLTVASISIKQYLSSVQPTTTPNSVGDKLKFSSPVLKQKSQISIRNPVFLLPETDISDRLVNYLKTFDTLEPYLAAFLKNTTNEKIRMLRSGYKKFMFDPDIYVVKVSNLVVGIEDNFYDRAMLNRARFGRQYLSRMTGTFYYNESQTLNYLRQTLHSYNLCEIRVALLSVQIKPLLGGNASSSQKEVKYWVKGLKNKLMGDRSQMFGNMSPCKRQEPYNPYKIDQKDNQNRLIKAKNGHLSFEISKLEMRIRDYPKNIIQCNLIAGQGDYIMTKDIYEDIVHHVLAQAKIGQIQSRVGLCMMSGFTEIYHRLSKYRLAIDKYKNTEQFLQTLRSKKNIKQSKYKPYWHILHKEAIWYLKVQKQSQITVNVLTDLTPYSDKCLKLNIGGFTFVSNPFESELKVNYLELFGEEKIEKKVKRRIKIGMEQPENENVAKESPKKVSEKILYLGTHSMNIKSRYQQPFLKLIFAFQIGYADQMTEQNDYSQNCIKFSEDIMTEVWKIKQLKADWLLIHGLIQPNSKKQADILKKDEQSSYMDLFKMTANMQLKNKEKQLSIFSVLKQVSFSCQLNNLFVQLSDRHNKVDFITDEFKVAVTAEAHLEEWKTRHFLLSVSNIIGRLRMLKNKPIGASILMPNKQFLKMFKQLDEVDLLRGSTSSQYFKQIFLTCRDLRLWLGKYVFIDNKLFFINKKVQLGSLKIQLSIELKNILASLYENLFSSTISRIEQLSANKEYIKLPIQKLREAVMMVIRNNRKMKRMVKKKQIQIRCKNIEIGLRTMSQLLLLTTETQSGLTFNKSYHEEDKYLIDPKIIVHYFFKNLQLWVSCETNPAWIVGKTYSPNRYFRAEKVLTSAEVTMDLDKHDSQLLPQEYLAVVKRKQISRCTNLKVRFQKGSVSLTHENLVVLKDISQFIVELANSKQRKKKELMLQKNKYEQLMTLGRQKLRVDIVEKQLSLQKQMPFALQIKAQFLLDEIDFKLISTKNRDASSFTFLLMQSSNISVKMNVFENDYTEKQFAIHNLSIINTMEKPNSLYQNFFQMNHEQGLAVRLELKGFDIYVNNPTVKWDFIKNATIHFNPIKIKLTDQLYEQICYFFFGSKPDEEPSKQSDQPKQYESILPDYYAKVLIDEFKLQAWFRTDSIIKRLQGVNVKLETFELNQQFLNKKGMFQLWVRFLVKQLAGQFFNVLGQKLFG